MRAPSTFEQTERLYNTPYGHFNPLDKYNPHPTARATNPICGLTTSWGKFPQCTPPSQLARAINIALDNRVQHASSTGQLIETYNVAQADVTSRNSSPASSSLQSPERTL